MRSGLPPLDSASSARQQTPQQNYGRQWTGLRPAPQPRASCLRGGFGGQPKLLSCLRPLRSKRAPFTRASEADRNSAPGYSWPPHLYQEKSSLGHCASNCQQKFQPFLTRSMQAANSCRGPARLRPFNLSNHALPETTVPAALAACVAWLQAIAP